MQPVYLVNAYADPVVVKVTGKANYMNCNAFREFMDKMIVDGKERIVIDFDACTGMDSTFLGILAGIAIDLKRADRGGELRLVRLSQRNDELIRNLGLQNLLAIDRETNFIAEAEGEMEQLDDAPVAKPDEMLKAHENLIAADIDNLEKFQDVISYLRNEVEGNER